MTNYETELLESLEREQEAFNILNETCENWRRNCMKLLKQYTELLIKNDDLVKENIELKALLSTYDEKYNNIEYTKSNAKMTPDELKLYESGYDSAMEGYDPYVL